MSMTKGRTKLGVDYVRDNGSFKLKGGLFKNQVSTSSRGGLCRKCGSSLSKGCVM